MTKIKQEGPAESSSTASPVAARKAQLPNACVPPSSTHPPTSQVWIIFGATGLMGRELVRAALNNGDKVTAVGRTHEHSLQQMQDWHDNCLGLQCDVRVRDSVDAVYRKTIDRFGVYHVVANCTGYGVIGACEDQDLLDMQNQFGTNFHGILNIIQLSLPYFRIRQSGRYLIFSSTSGALGVPGLASYCATKYATEAIVESMLYEVDAYDIKATLVAPGPLRDDAQDASDPTWQTISRKLAVPLDSSTQAYRHFLIKPPSAPYDDVDAPAQHASKTARWLSGNQPTSAQKSAEVLWQLGHCKYPPLRLLLGSYAVESIRDRLRCITEEIEDWNHLNFGNNNDQASQTGREEDQDTDWDEPHDTGAVHDHSAAAT